MLKLSNAVLAENKTKFSLKGYSEIFIKLLVEFSSKFYKNEVIIQMKHNGLVEFNGVTLEQLEADRFHSNYLQNGTEPRIRLKQ